MTRHLAILLLLLSCLRVSAAPANDNFSDAQILQANSATLTTSTEGAGSEFGEPAILHNAPRSTVWFAWTAPADGLLIVSTEGSAFDTVLALFSGATLETLETLDENDDAQGSTSLVSSLVTGGATYRICVDGYEGTSGLLKLSLLLREGVTRPPNDDYKNAIPLSGSNVAVDASNFLATLEPNELTPTTSGGASVWWTWISPASGRYLVSTAGSEFDTILAIYNGQTLVSWNDNPETGSAAKVRILNALEGSRFHISVQGFANSSGAIKLQINPEPLQPAPEWSALDSTGQIFQSASLAGKVAILDFWATWCGSCIEDTAFLVTLQNTYGAEGLAVVGISTDVEGFDVVRPFIENYNVTYPSTVTNPEIEKSFGPLPVIPTTILIDRNGMLVERYVGRLPGSFESTVRQLLALPVSLQASLAGAEIVLRWPANAIGYTLQSASALLADTWDNVDTRPTRTGADYIIRIPLASTQRSFRLIRN